MGINDLLPRLPGGGPKDYKHSFYGALAKQTTVPLDAASALFQFAARHASDYLSGNLTPALVEWSRFLNYIRSICKWKLVVIMDGLDNMHKAPENDRRRVARENAQANNNLMGQIKNTPEYIARATQVCNFMNITVRTAYEEADPQVVYEASQSDDVLIPVTGDSDLLAYECDGISVHKIIIVKAFNHQWYRFIDLDADVKEGDYPLRDMRIQHGVIVFQLYAACRGCDFTVSTCGIEGIGYKTFIELVGIVVDGGKELNANTLASAIWEHNNEVAQKNNFKSSDDIEEYLQHIVDIYSNGSVYDRNSNVINMGTGIIINKADELSLQHMTGEVNCRTKAPHSEELLAKIRDTDYSQLIKVTAEDTSTIRGANLPDNKTVEQCTVGELRDFIAARGGTITGMNKAALIKLTKYYQLVETEVRVL